MLPKSHRLSEERDFRRVALKGRAFFIRECGIKVLRNYNKNQPSRIGIVVPKKLTKTIVKRNRIKRQVRHIFIELLPRLKQGYDIVLITRAGVLELTFEEMAQRVRAVLERARLIHED